MLFALVVPCLFMANVEMLIGRTTGVTEDGVMGGQSSATVSTDGVMGGGSSGSVTVGDTVTFEGFVNVNGGGFAYVTLFGQAMDLSNEIGIWLSFDTLPISIFGAAPTGFTIELDGGRSCTMSAAFAVPSTIVSETTHAFVPLSYFRPKGAHWDYRPWRTGVPSYCTSARTTSMSSVLRLSFGVYYQQGPFRLVLRAVSTLHSSS